MTQGNSLLYFAQKFLLALGQGNTTEASDLACALSRECIDAAGLSAARAVLEGDPNWASKATELAVKIVLSAPGGDVPEEIGTALRKEMR